MGTLASSCAVIVAQTQPSLLFARHHHHPSKPPSSSLVRSISSRLPNNSSISLFISLSLSAGIRPSSLSYSSMAAPPFRICASSSIGAREEELEDSSSRLVGGNDLLIVGPGVLGRLVAEKWRQEHQSCQIFGQTMTADHHDELIGVGINPFLKGMKPAHQFPYVIFCAPPSGTPDYPGDVRLAASNWNGEGSLLFTSSSAIIDCNDNGSCDEDTPVVPIGRSPRTDVLLKSEKVAMEFGGCVLRLAGLYKVDRGAHVYWLRKGTVEARPDHILNLIHYEDAASLCVAILKKKLRGRIFLGCDNHPLSRQEVIDLVNRSGKFSRSFKGFTGKNDLLGKRLDNSRTREEVGWEPKYPSFSQFLGISD